MINTFEEITTLDAQTCAKIKTEFPSDILVKAQMGTTKDVAAWMERTFIGIDFRGIRGYLGLLPAEDIELAKQRIVDFVNGKKQHLCPACDTDSCGGECESCEHCG